jgi:enoyl-CoA hydratase
MISIDERDDVVCVRLDHGPVNALDLELLAGITETFTRLDTSDHAAIVLTGAGRSFCAGVDLWRVIGEGPEYVTAFLPALSDAFLAVFTVGKPVVAAVNGHAIAGGAVLAYACDYRLMADGDGRIGLTELRVGVPFPPVALEIVAFAVGADEARKAIISAATYEPHEALTRGHIDRLAAPSDLLGAAVNSARTLANQIPPDAFRLTKEQLQAAVGERLARFRPRFDPHIAQLWARGVRDGRIQQYMEEIGSQKQQGIRTPRHDRPM